MSTNWNKKINEYYNKKDQINDSFNWIQLIDTLLLFQSNVIKPKNRPLVRYDIDPMIENHTYLVNYDSIYESLADKVMANKK